MAQVSFCFVFYATLEYACANYLMRVDGRCEYRTWCEHGSWCEHTAPCPPTPTPPICSHRLREAIASLPETHPARANLHRKREKNVIDLVESGIVK